DRVDVLRHRLGTPAHRVEPAGVDGRELRSHDEPSRGDGVREPRHQATAAGRRRSIRSFAMPPAVRAAAAEPSAPTTSAYSCVTGAPPTITITSLRMPAFSSALMFALNIGIVVVRNAEKPTMSGSCSFTCATKVSGATLTPRSTTVKPAPSS